MTRRQFLALILPLFAVIVGFIVVSVVDRSRGDSPPWDEDFASYVRESFSRDYVDGLGDRRAQEAAYFAALHAWVHHFDPYGEIVPPWEVDRRRESSSGQYYGIGLRVDRPDGEGAAMQIPIVGVKPEGPADTAGIRVGDRMLAVDGTPVGTLYERGGLGELSETIRGDRDTEVRLRLRAPDGAEREVDVTRDAVDHGSVFGARFLDERNRIGYVRLNAFRLDTAPKLEGELKRMIEEGLRALVLDLRDNSGGLLPQAIDVADVFLESGVIVRVRGRERVFSETHSARAEGTVLPRMPLVVLINSGSASASEIVAGALRDHRRAMLVGERTYGKFLVQTLQEVPTEFGVALFKRTTALYETPAGHSYPRRSREANDPLAGIEPDLIVPMSDEERDTLVQRIFPAEVFADWTPEPPAEAEDFLDVQLEAAVQILTGRTYYPRLLAAPRR